MRRGLFTIFFLLAATGLHAAANLQVFVSVLPSSVVTNGSITVEVLVKNNGAVQANGVLPSLATVDPYAGASGSVSKTAGPLPSTPAVLPAGFSVNYTFTYSATACGDAAFSANASGTEEGTGNPLTAVDQVANLSVLCPTPTMTVTPWIIYETPTPVPQESSAGVRSNVFRPGGTPVQLDYALSHDSPITIRIFDRNGKIQRVMKRQVAAGSHTESWDGRADSGSFVATGIYVVHFQGKGLNKTAKIAVIK